MPRPARTRPQPWAGTLAPDGTDDFAKPARLGANELGRFPGEHWSLIERAALLHRAGRYWEAVPLLEHSLAADGRPGVQVVAWLWLALAHQRLGRRKVIPSFGEKYWN